MSQHSIHDTRLGLGCGQNKIATAAVECRVGLHIDLPYLGANTPHSGQCVVELSWKRQSTNLLSAAILSRNHSRGSSALLACTAESSRASSDSRSSGKTRSGTTPLVCAPVGSAAPSRLLPGDCCFALPPQLPAVSGRTNILRSRCSVGGANSTSVSLSSSLSSSATSASCIHRIGCGSSTSVSAHGSRSARHHVDMVGWRSKQRPAALPTGSPRQ
eukprot:scaffold46091_cov92-Phaeocystis_antarctica.AAC.1